jgi:hypothetical protein
MVNEDAVATTAARAVEDAAPPACERSGRVTGKKTPAQGRGVERFENENR